MKENKSIHIKGDNRGIAITGDGNTVNFPKHIIPKVLTKQIGLANDIDFVGRKDELQKVDELLNQNSMLLLLNGIGGIGKSTLASYYLNQKKDDFDYYGFIEVGEDIKSSLTSTLATALGLKPNKLDDMFDEAMNKLQNLKGHKLLVFDDLKDIAKQEKEIDTILTLKNSGYKLLFTSRENYENITQYCLDVMNLNDARELFLRYYPTDEIEIEKVDKILEYLDYHTLFIELTAKTLKEKSHSLSLDTILKKFKNGEFTAIKRTRKEDFNTYLNQLFATDSILTDDEILLFLKKLSVLPSVEISFEDLYKFLVCDNKESLEELLVELVNNGWLIQTKNGYKFHQILKEFILENHTPQPEDTEDIIVFFVDLVDSLNTISSVINNKNSVIFLESVNKFLKNTLHIYDDILAILIHGEGYIYDILGNVNKAEILHKEALKIREKVLPENHIHFAISYGGIASIYEKKRDIENALKYHLKSLEIRELYPEYKSTIAIGYNNIGRMYQELGKLDNAEQFLTKSLYIRKEIHGDEHESTARAYNVLGKFYLDKYTKTNIEKLKQQAFELLEKSLEIRKKVLYENHPDIAKSYNSLAVFYISVNELEQAKKLLNHVIDNYIDDEHLENLAEVYCNLGTIFFLEKNKQETIENIDKAIEIWRTIFPENHPYIKQCKKILTRWDNHI